MNSRDISKKIIDSTYNYQSLFSKRGLICTFINPFGYTKAYSDFEVYEDFDAIFADGVFLCKMLELFYGKKVQRLSFDMTTVAKDLFDYSIRNDKSIYIVASHDEVVKNAINIILNVYPTLRIVGYRNGYFNSNEDRKSTIHTIISLNPDFVIVGMGFKHQELFLKELKHAKYEGIGFSCGGFIHQIPTNLNYFSPIINRLHLRALYRIIKEPSVAKRLPRVLLLFPFLFICDHIKLIFKKKVCQQ